MKRWMLTAALLAWAAGCSSDVQTSLWEQNKALSEQKTELTLEVERLRQENETLSGQVKTLTAVNKETRTAALVVPEMLVIGRHTGLYDKGTSGKPDSLVVYVEPRDAKQDTIKAAGNMQVELWNLAAAPEQAKLAAWEIGPEELKGLWGRGLLGAYYRLTFPLEGVLKGNEKDLTVKVEFTDYLTGKILTGQKVITF